MKLTEFKKLIRAEIRKALRERSKDEITTDKESVEAQIKAAQEKIKMLTQKKSELNAEKPSENA